MTRSDNRIWGVHRCDRCGVTKPFGFGFFHADGIGRLTTTCLSCPPNVPAVRPSRTTTTKGEKK